MRRLWEIQILWNAEDIGIQFYAKLKFWSSRRQKRSLWTKKLCVAKLFGFGSQLQQSLQKISVHSPYRYTILIIQSLNIIIGKHLQRKKKDQL